MTDAMVLLLILAGALVLFATQIVSIEAVALGVVALLALSGILTPAEAFAGFSSAATLTVAAMLVISAGLERSGVVDHVAARLVRIGGGGERRLLLALLVPTALFSAFMNNTPVVALMMPVAITLGRRFDVPPSKLLMPISFFAILGGTCTLIGTSTNILVDSLYREAGGPGFGMFELSAMGLVYLVVGSAYVIVLGRRVLPKRLGLSELLSAGGPDHFVAEVRVPAGSRLSGKPLGEAFAGAERATVLQLVRDEEPILRPSPDLRLEPDDVLLVEASARGIHKLVAGPDVEQSSVVADGERVSVSRVDLHIAEAVVTPNSAFRSRRVRALGLSRRFGVQVLALRRLGRQHQYQLRDLRVQAGDVLLVQGERDSLRALQEDGDALLIEGVARRIANPKKAPLALGVLAAVVTLASLGVAPIAHLAIAGAALMLLLRCLDVPDATRALDSSVLLLLAGTIPLGIAMERTGIAHGVAVWVAELAGDHGAIAVVSAFYLLTSVLTEILSNNATAVLMTPIGLSIANELGIDPKPILVAIAFGGSASFATPIGYQTNTMVMGPGGYAFRDFLRFGLPMNLLLWIVATLMIPVFWPA